MLLNAAVTLFQYFRYFIFKQKLEVEYATFKKKFS